MNPNDFADLLNDLPDEMIVSANTATYKRRPIRIYIPAAAACAAVLLAAVLYPKLHMQSPERLDSTPEAVMTETTSQTELTETALTVTQTVTTATAASRTEQTETAQSTVTAAGSTTAQRTTAYTTARTVTTRQTTATVTAVSAAVTSHSETVTAAALTTVSEAQKTALFTTESITGTIEFTDFSEGPVEPVTVIWETTAFYSGEFFHNEQENSGTVSETTADPAEGIESEETTTTTETTATVTITETEGLS